MSAENETVMTTDGGGKSWPSSHAMDARYRLPWFGGPIYLRLVVGREKRPETRSRTEIAASIRKSLLNVLIFTLAACVLYSAVITAVLLASAVLL